MLQHICSGAARAVGTIATNGQAGVCSFLFFSHPRALVPRHRCRCRCYVCLLKVRARASRRRWWGVSPQSRMGVCERGCRDTTATMARHMQTGHGGAHVRAGLQRWQSFVSLLQAIQTMICIMFGRVCEHIGNCKDSKEPLADNGSHRLRLWALVGSRPPHGICIGCHVDIHPMGSSGVSRGHSPRAPNEALLFVVVTSLGGSWGF